MVQPIGNARSRSALKMVAAFLVYLLLAVLSSWPLITQMQTHLADHFGDGALHLWNSWWVLQALREGTTPFYTDFLFFPHGASLVTENFAWMHIVPALLLSPLMNSIAAFNLAVLLNLALCGLAMFWAAYRLTGSHAAAFIAGFIYQMWPYRLARLDLPNMLATFWVPLFVIFLIRTLENGRRGDALLAGVCLALVGYSRWQFLIPAALMGIIILFFYGWLWRKDNWRRAVTNLAVLGMVTALLILPPFISLFRDPAGYEELVFSGDEEVLMSADLLSYITPSQYHATLSTYSKPLHDRYYFDRETTRRRPTYVGLVPLLLAVAGIVWLRKKAWPWVMMFLLFLLLALGPILRFNGVLYERVPTLYGLLAPLGILELMRNPERFAIFMALPVAVLAAFGLAGVLAKHQRLPRWAWPITAVLSVLIFWEYYAPQTVLRDYSDRPAFYSNLAREAGSFAILNLPFDNIKTRFNMGAQTVHGRPIVQGNLSRIPAAAYDYINDNRWLATLRRTGEMAPAFSDTSRQLQNLAADGIRYLLLHKDQVGADRIAHWQRALIAHPAFEDDALIVYRTRPTAGSDFDVAPGWGTGPAPVTVSLSAACLHPQHVLVVSIGWGSGQAPGVDLDAELALVDEDGAERTSERYPLVEGWPTSEWPANALAQGHYPVDLPEDVGPGSYDIDMVLRESGSGAVWTGPHTIGQIGVQEMICNVASELEAVDANMLFGDQLRLVEYRAVQVADKLKLDLYWRAERFVDGEYTVFVHVFEPERGVPVAQDDGRPRDGAYPMRYWQPGEVVDDRVAISLKEVPPGEYGIAIGVYDPATGVRLPLVDQNGDLLVADGRFVLGEKVVIP